MKMKKYISLMQIGILTLLLCACFEKEPLQETAVLERQGSASAETVMPEQADDVSGGRQIQLFTD